MNRFLKYLAVVGTVVALGGAAFGIVAAQTDETPTQTEDPAATPDATDEAKPDRAEVLDNFMARLAEELGISQEELTAAIRATSLGLLDDAVADGRVTEEEAAKIRERIESGEGAFPFFGGRHHGPGPDGFKGPRGHHGFGGFGRHGGLGIGAGLDELATFLGIDEAALGDQFQNGETLAQIAEANGKSREELVNFLLGQVQERLATAVTDGDLTQEEADQHLERARNGIEMVVDFEIPSFGDWGNFSPGDFKFPFAPDPPEEGADTTGLTL